MAGRLYTAFLYPHTQVVMIAIASRMIMPGIIPKVSKTNGIESTPSPICVFIMRIDVPIHPTYVWCKDWCIMGNRECNLHLGTIKSSCQHLVYRTTPGCALRLTFGPPS